MFCCSRFPSFFISFFTTRGLRSSRELRGRERQVLLPDSTRVLPSLLCWIHRLSSCLWPPAPFPLYLFLSFSGSVLWKANCLLVRVGASDPDVAHQMQHMSCSQCPDVIMSRKRSAGRTVGTWTAAREHGKHAADPKQSWGTRGRKHGDFIH